MSDSVQRIRRYPDAEANETVFGWQQTCPTQASDGYRAIEQSHAFPSRYLNIDPKQEGGGFCLGPQMKVGALLGGELTVNSGT